MRWSMDDVRVTVVEPVGAGGAIVERVALSFVRMKYEYVLLTNLGQRGGTVTALFDLRSQESIVTRMRTTSNRSFAFTCADLPPSVARS